MALHTHWAVCFSEFPWRLESGVMFPPQNKTYFVSAPSVKGSENSCSFSKFITRCFHTSLEQGCWETKAHFRYCNYGRFCFKYNKQNFENCLQINNGGPTTNLNRSFLKHGDAILGVLGQLEQGDGCALMDCFVFWLKVMYQRCHGSSLTKGHAITAPHAAVANGLSHGSTQPVISL